MKNWIEFKCRECSTEWTQEWWEGMNGPCPECDLPNSAVAWDLTELADADDGKFWDTTT
jgi:Zn finger protein HypA/HybF involved in hydrogenase expression